MNFLRTSSGLIASHSIDVIGGLNVRATGNYHLIEYHVGREPRLTYATQEAVEGFLFTTEDFHE